MHCSFRRLSARIKSPRKYTSVLSQPPPAPAEETPPRCDDFHRIVSGLWTGEGAGNQQGHHSTPKGTQVAWRRTRPLLMAAVAVPRLPSYQLGEGRGGIAEGRGQRVGDSMLRAWAGPAAAGAQWRKSASSAAGTSSGPPPFLSRFEELTTAKLALTIGVKAVELAGVTGMSVEST